jgi:hypothetical protein
MFLYIYFITILQKYMLRHKFCKTIHLLPQLTAVGAARSRPLAWDRHSVVPHSVRDLASWATALGPSVVGHDARVWLPI